MMEFVGKTVKKKFEGHGVFQGTVKSYDTSSGFLKIVYEDGDSEELDVSEVSALLHGEQGASSCARPGRKPNKRRRVGDVKGGDAGGNSSDSDVFFDADASFGSVRNNVGSIGGAVDSNGYLNVGDEANGEVGGSLESGEQVDLSLDVNGVVDVSDGDDEDAEVDGLEDNSAVNDGQECGFDANLGVRGGIKNGLDGDSLLGMKEPVSVEIGGIFDLNDIDDGTLVEVPVSDGLCVGLVDSVQMMGAVSIEVLEECDVNCVLEVYHERVNGNQFTRHSDRRGRRSKVAYDLNSMPDTTVLITGTVDANDVDDDYATITDVNEDRMGNVYNEAGGRRGRRRKVTDNLDSVPAMSVLTDANCVKDDSTVFTGENKGDLGSACKEFIGSGSKRKLSDAVDSTPETTVLRRSTRRVSARFNVSTIETSITANESSASHAVSARRKQRPIKSYQPVVLPPKVDLPPSSVKLDFDGIPVLDLFAVYACLRSFSTILFLSPFELEEFVAALRCNSPSHLLDCTHVSILQHLRKHLEFLAAEGSESASNCLRGLDWDFLDLLTWPVFVVEYLLILGSGSKPECDLNLFQFKSDYYQQPVVLKVDILRCLCDDLIEVEAIRSELYRRSSGAESDMEFDRITNRGSNKKRRAAADMSSTSCLTEDDADYTADWNSDECCLCKMDGNLICCDGCPAAYHSKCVGVSSASLPEGDWYCPECCMDRHKPWMQPPKSLRGAKLLGVDPYGRVYFRSCGYLLVSDSYDSGPFNYYHKDDLPAVVEVLKSSEMCYGSILETILKLWDMPISLHGAKNESFSRCSDRLDVEISKPLTTVCPGSEGSAENTHMCSLDQKIENEVPAGLSNDAEVQGKLLSVVPGCSSSALNTNDWDKSNMQTCTMYTNYYGLARVAASVADELQLKSSRGKVEGSIKSEDVMSDQLKIIKKSLMFYQPNIPCHIDVEKEKCGWCYSCRVPAPDSDCLFNMCLFPLQTGSASDTVSLPSRCCGKSHLIDVACRMLSMESRLQGLLSGPWISPQYSKLWRKSIIKASDIQTVKKLLLMLERNLHYLALSAEWLEHVDSAVTMGSSCHFVSSSRVGRKRARYSETESNPSLHSAAGLSMFWRRGDRVSRCLFSWKVLPRIMASKAARQAGCSKILDISYPENSNFAKRSKFVAWRAAVESSTTAEQLALQARELDSNIRWDDIENRNPLLMLDKESRKSFRLFKKVVIRRKCMEKEGTKYLLDFGKRRSVPDIVLKHGHAVEESSSGRKKYWLNESYVPLHLLKCFEERKISRKSSKIGNDKPSEDGLAVKNPLNKRGFAYLFVKAERSEHHQCGHCNKFVPIRDAVRCQSCKGFFHRRHVRKSGGSFLADCTFTCHRCESQKCVKNGRTGKADAKKKENGIKKPKVHLKKTKLASVGRKVQFKGSRTIGVSQALKSRKGSKVVVIPLRRSSRTAAKYNPLQNKKVEGQKKRKQVSLPKKKVGRPKKVKHCNSGEETIEEPEKAPLQHKMRTVTCHSYWLNGFLLSGKADDGRVTHFRRLRFLAPFESVIPDQPKCHLCFERTYTSSLNYISCEICGKWFHGDAFGLDPEDMDKLIGFRCHGCRKVDCPVCPHVSRSPGSQMLDAQTCFLTAEEATNACPLSNAIDLSIKQLPNDNKESYNAINSDSMNKQEQLRNATDSDHCLVLESNLQVGKNHKVANVEVQMDNSNFQEFGAGFSNTIYGKSHCRRL